MILLLLLLSLNVIFLDVYIFRYIRYKKKTISYYLKKDKWVFFSLEYFDIIFLESRFIWKRKLFNY